MRRSRRGNFSDRRVERAGAGFKRQETSRDWSSMNGAARRRMACYPRFSPLRLTALPGGTDTNAAAKSALFRDRTKPKRRFIAPKCRPRDMETTPGLPCLRPAARPLEPHARGAPTTALTLPADNITIECRKTAIRHCPWTPRAMPFRFPAKPPLGTSVAGLHARWIQHRQSPRRRVMRQGFKPEGPKRRRRFGA